MNPLKPAALAGLLFISSLSYADYNYRADLTQVKKDRIHISLRCEAQQKDQVLFHFAKTVPGTYATLNYGKYIKDFKATDANGKKLKVERKDINTFVIYQAKSLAHISYWAEESWKNKGKDKIFEPAGTGYEQDRYFFINNGALFGFFDQELNQPYLLTFVKPASVKGYSSLVRTSEQNGEEQYKASDYHQLIDNPFLFTNEKAEFLKVSNADVTIASYYEDSDSSAYHIRKKIEPSMKAIEKYVGHLPIDHYSFLNYIDNKQKVGKMLESGKPNFFQMLRLYAMLSGQAYGALEHGNSSSYYLADFGNRYYTNMVIETAIHEFMHIYTPLNLHSERIGDFDYNDPKMSKHLWLYEGVTEYFATHIQIQGRLDSLDNLLKQNIRSKIEQAARYPDSIPFTVMSEHVLDKPYIDLYSHVYDRGALIAMLLDFEIMRLTEGSKTLKSVVLDLSAKYGPKRSFKEEEIIPVFVQSVHPELQGFFDKYVTGTTPLDLEGGFKTVGISFKKEETGPVPFNILSAENGVQATGSILGDDKVVIRKAGKNNTPGFMKGDELSRKELTWVYRDERGNYVPEGTMLSLTVMRKGEQVTLRFPAKFREATLKNQFSILPEPSADQQKYFRIWVD